MAGEVGEGSRLPVPLEIGRGGAEYGADRRELPGDKARVAQLADPEREVPAFLDQVDEAVGEADVDGERRVEPGEIGDRRHGLPEPEGEWAG